MRRVWIVAVSIGLWPVLAFGQTGWGRITKGGPFAEFRDGDWDMYQATVVRAADSAPDADPLTWTNTKTGAQGNVKVVKRYDRPGVGECRDLSGEASARGRTGPFAVTLCRKPGGKWLIG
jgi:surface antigen